MSKTGTYKMIDGELVKISDRVPGLGYVEASIFTPFVDRMIDGKPREFTSLKKWNDTLKQHGMFEVPKDAQKSGFWNDVRKNKPNRSIGDPAKIAAEALKNV